eukprot:m.313 g.313  ORF g.313 m.313 type:complete len:56 (+) comp402_c0_seq1:314-481(+)
MLMLIYSDGTVNATGAMVACRMQSCGFTLYQLLVTTAVVSAYYCYCYYTVMQIDF